MSKKNIIIWTVLFLVFIIAVVAIIVSSRYAPVPQSVNTSSVVVETTPALVDSVGEELPVEKEAEVETTVEPVQIELVQPEAQRPADFPEGVPFDSETFTEELDPALQDTL